MSDNKENFDDSVAHHTPQKEITIIKSSSAVSKKKIPIPPEMKAKSPGAIKHTDGYSYTLKGTNFAKRGNQWVGYYERMILKKIIINSTTYCIL